MSKIFRTRPERNCRELGLEGRSAIPWAYGSKMNYQSLLLRVVFLLDDDPDCWIRSSSHATFNASCSTTYRVLGNGPT